MSPADGAMDVSVTTAVMQSCVVGDDQGVTTQLASYSSNATGLTAINTVELGGLAPNITGGGQHYFWGSRAVNANEHRANGSLLLAGATLADAGAGASDLIIGDGVGNVGLTLRAALAGVSRMVFGDSSDPDRFRVQGDHGGGSLDIYADGGRDFRAMADAIELGRVYSDETDGAGSFAVNTWNVGSTTGETSLGGPFASRHLVTQASASGAVTGELTYTFPEAYDEPPICFIEGVGVDAEGWTLGTVTDTAAGILFNGNLNIGQQTGFNLLVVGRRN